MTLPDLGAWLGGHRDGDAALSLERSVVKQLHHEMQRLRQSNDRVRKQNSKLRRRIVRLKAGEIDAEECGED